MEIDESISCQKQHKNQFLPSFLHAVIFPRWIKRTQPLKKVCAVHRGL